VKRAKLTLPQVKHHNRRLIMQALYAGAANNRAALAQQTNLTKPTVSDLVSKLIDEGFLVEDGVAQTGEGPGKPHHRLRFLPDARQVIGVSIDAQSAQGVLADLSGVTIAHHQNEVAGVQGEAAWEALEETINGLVAQLTSPLLCIGVGVAGVVDAMSGVVLSAPGLGWQAFPLAQRLSETFEVPGYVANSTQLAAMSYYAFGDVSSVDRLAVVLVDDSVGVGMVLNGATYTGGNEIGYLRMIERSGRTTGLDTTASLAQLLGWPAVKARATALKKQYRNSMIPDGPLTCLDLRAAMAHGDRVALKLRDELADYLGAVFAWIIALFQPEHILMTGLIADLGTSLLNQAIANAKRLTVPELVAGVHFSIDSTPNPVALGAVAQTLRLELGLI
jgi:predicted NBD/HSP70 family sugar kinase